MNQFDHRETLVRFDGGFESADKIIFSHPLIFFSKISRKDVLGFIVPETFMDQFMQKLQEAASCPPPTSGFTKGGIFVIFCSEKIGLRLDYQMIIAAVR